MKKFTIKLLLAGMLCGAVAPSLKAWNKSHTLGVIAGVGTVVSVISGLAARNFAETEKTLYATQKTYSPALRAIIMDLQELFKDGPNSADGNRSALKHLISRLEALQVCIAWTDQKVFNDAQREKISEKIVACLSCAKDPYSVYVNFYGDVLNAVSELLGLLNHGIDPSYNAQNPEKSLTRQGYTSARNWAIGSGLLAVGAFLYSFKK